MPSVGIAGFAIYTADPAVLIVGGIATAAIFLSGGIYGIYINCLMSDSNRAKYLAALNEDEAKEESKETVN